MKKETKEKIERMPFKKIKIDKETSIIDSPILLEGHIVNFEGRIAIKIAPYSWEVYDYKKTVYGK